MLLLLCFLYVFESFFFFSSFLKLLAGYRMCIYTFAPFKPCSFPSIRLSLAVCKISNNEENIRFNRKENRETSRNGIFSLEKRSIFGWMLMCALLSGILWNCSKFCPSTKQPRFFRNSR